MVKNKMNDELISVIVPIYNAEKFIDKSVGSVINQTYQNLEILLIDDGSTDSSSLLCDEYAKKDKRIKVFHQENKGLSCARNKGIDNANGDYYVFIDADDEALPKMIEELYKLLKENDADISICSYEELYEDGTVISPCTNGNKGKIWSYTDDKKYLQIEYDYIRTVVQWNKLFKKEIFDDLRYPEGLYHEDEHIIHRQLQKAKKVTYTSEVLYIYYRHEGSITFNPDCKKLYDAILAFYDRFCFFKDLEKESCILYSYNILKYYTHELKTIDSKDKYYYLPKAKNLVKKAYKKLSFEQRIVYTLMKIKRFKRLLKSFIGKYLLTYK